MTEQFVLEQVFGDGGTVDGQEGGAIATAVVMEGAGDDIFSGTRLSGDQHRHRCGAHQQDLLADLLHRARRTDQPFVQETAALEQPVNRRGELVGVDGHGDNLL